MPTLTPERTVEDVIAGWRCGLEKDGWDNPAGPQFVGDYVEYEITMTGNSTYDPYTVGSVCTQGSCTYCC